MAKYEIEWGVGCNIGGHAEITARSDEEAEKIAKDNLDRWVDEESYWEANEVDEIETYEITCSIDGHFDQTYEIEADNIPDAEREAAKLYKSHLHTMIDIESE